MTPRVFILAALAAAALSAGCETLEGIAQRFTGAGQSAVKAGPVTARAVAARPASMLSGQTSTNYEIALRSFALEADAPLVAPCGRERTVTFLGVERLEPVDEVLQTLKAEDGWVYRERVEVAGCGVARRHAFYPTIDADWGFLSFEPGVPGATTASLQLQRDVVAQLVTQAAGVAAAKLPPGMCDAMANEPWVVDSRVLVAPASGKWAEGWMISACGVRSEITIDFTETAQGVKFSAELPVG